MNTKTEFSGMESIGLSIVAELVRRAAKENKDLGKTQLQKMVYFLQEIGIQMNYHFEMYHYGPYCFELADDLGRLGTLGILKITPDEEGYGYHILAGEHLEKGLSGETDLSQYSEQLNWVTEKLSSVSAATIELLATIQFVRNAMQKRGGSASKEEIVDKVKQLKPKFKKSQIGEKYDFLDSFIQQSS